MTESKISAAKLWLTTTPGSGERLGCGDMPYLAAALYGMTTVPTTDVPTCAADTKWRLYVNPEWLDEVSVPDLATALAHQVWHLLSDHAARAEAMQVGRRERKAWEGATDCCIAELLTSAGLAHDLVLPAKLGLPADRSAEEYFARITRLSCTSPPPDEGDDDEIPGGPGSMSCGSACDGLPRRWEVPEGSEAHPGLSAVEAAGLRRVVAIEFREHITTRGTVPGDALRWVQQILEPTVSWQQVLAASVRRAVAHVGGAVDYTYSRVSRRRAAAPRVVFPGMRRPLPSVAAVVDTSGSVDDGLLAQALAEVEGTLQGLGVAGGSVTVLACDAAVQSVKAVRRAKDAVLGGGGGTDMCAGIEAAVQLRPRPDVVVVLTDGYTPWPAEPPGVAVVGGLLGRDRAMLPPTPDWVMRVECVA